MRVLWCRCCRRSWCCFPPNTPCCLAPAHLARPTQPSLLFTITAEQAAAERGAGGGRRRQALAQRLCHQGGVGGCMGQWRVWWRAAELLRLAWILPTAGLGCGERASDRQPSPPAQPPAPRPPPRAAPAQASALALRRVPEVNASWMGDFIRQYHSVDCSVAVQVRAPAGQLLAAGRGRRPGGGTAADGTPPAGPSPRARHALTPILNAAPVCLATPRRRPRA